MILVPSPWTRVNDKFIYNDSIDATPVLTDVLHKLVATPPNNVQDRYNCDFYKNIALDIVTETVFDYPYPCITEKTIRPLANKRMFIIVGAANILQLLRSKGFETFSDVINETYDTINDPVDRFNSVVNSINTFLDRPINDIKEYYIKNQDRFEHNFQLVSRLEEIELETICKLFKISYNNV